MGWHSVASRSAAEEYGKQNWRRYAARRRTWTTFWLGAGGLLGLIWLVRAAARKASEVRVSAASLPLPSAGWFLLAAAAVLVGVLAWRWGVRARRPYRVPRRRYSRRR